MAMTLNEHDFNSVRTAVEAYFRAAAALGSASLLARSASLLASEEADACDGAAEDRDFMLDRATTYAEKAGLMSASAIALLSHSERWFAHVEQPSADLDEILVAFAADVERAGEEYAAVVTALEDTTLASHDEYEELLDSLRLGARFLAGEAAVFAAFVAGELDEPDGAA